LLAENRLELESDKKLAQDVAAVVADSSRDLYPVAEIAASAPADFQVRPQTMLLSLSRALSSFPLHLAALSTAVDLDALRLSSHWAVFRYLWAFEQVEARIGLTRALDLVLGHQRSVVSEQLSIAAAVYVVENVVFGDPTVVPTVVDVDAASQDAWLSSQLPDLKKIRPDYFIYDDSRRRQQLIVLEVKGTSQSRSVLLRQLSRGADQVLSVPDVAGLQVRRIVIGATVGRARLRVYALEVSGPTEARRRARSRLARQRGGGAILPEEDLVAAAPRVDRVPDEIIGPELTEAVDAANDVRLSTFAGRPTVQPAGRLTDLWESLRLDLLPEVQSSIGSLRGTTREVVADGRRLGVFLGVEESVLRTLGRGPTARESRARLLEDRRRLFLERADRSPHVSTSIEVEWNLPGGRPIAGALASDGCLMALSQAE
jgi:hypothetical protein